ncbi:MAG: SAM-dependent methyltransferase, partial [Verrucomicrobia bacterium]|nr:SAM-dependent methyltransferase [Verrucomicrobiota bacterium]
MICADAIPWLRERGRIDGACAVTSLPDVSEVGVTLEVWRAWFLGAVRLVVNAVPDESAALFFQSDIKRDGEWIDKGAMVIGAAQDAGARVLFHKIVLRRPAGMLTTGRPGFTHFIAVSRALKCPEVLTIPDVIADAGEQKWVRAMGVRAAGHA